MAGETSTEKAPIDAPADRHEYGRTVTRSVARQLRRAARQLSVLADFSAHPADDQYAVLSALQSVNRALVELELAHP
ncbi:MAG: hypothetical protein KGJ77_01365 [Acidobacteriota bacterium]|nr:hypothetical protein [Acidobacteriota bacterium]